MLDKVSFTSQSYEIYCKKKKKNNEKMQLADLFWFQCVATIICFLFLFLFLIEALGS